MINKVLEIPLVKFFWERFNNSHILKFIFVGGLNTTVAYISFASLILLEVHYALAMTISHIIGVVHSYLWNKFFTFRNNKQVTRREVVKFITVYTVVYAVNIGLLWFFVDSQNIDPLIVQAFAVIIIAIISFIGQKYWAFREDH